MRKLYILLLIMLTASFAQGQQLSLRSQFMFDDFLLNPAIAGTKEYNPLSLTFRRQWTGIQGAPVTQSLSYHAYAGKNLGLGGYVFNDVTGPTRRSGLNFSVGYQLNLSKDNTKKLSFGLSALMFQHIFDMTKLTTDQPNDITLLSAHNSYLSPDANFGMYFYSGSKYYIGYSTHHLIQSKLDLLNILNEIDNPINRTHYLAGGYNFSLGTNYLLSPSLLFQFIETFPYQYEIGTNLTYKNTVWLGASYRNQDAIVGIFGFRYNQLCIGYSYDYSITDISGYNNGSHEVFLSIRFDRTEKTADIQKVPWDKRNRLFTP